jgi:plastocyanin
MGVLVVAGAAASMAVASSASTPNVVKALETDKVVINRYYGLGFHYSPGTLHVKSGSEITFEFGDKEQEVHTLTIAPKAELPRTVAQVSNCTVCKLALAHLKNPAQAQSGAPPIIASWILHAGKPAANGDAGLSTTGDSIAIQSGGPHASITIRVTAKPGTTLHFFCAVHPWMQGKIVVN